MSGINIREHMNEFQYLIKLLIYNLILYQKKYKMQEEKAQKQVSSKHILTTHEQLLLQIEKSIRQKFPKAIYYDSNNNMKIKNLDQLNEEYHSSSETRNKEGRGGNNVAQNLKKSLKSVIKSKLTTQIYHQFQTNYIKKYDIKSQKENFVLIFLFLHELVFEKKLQPQLINQIKECVVHNIHKYIDNSSNRKQEREEFHLKNIQEFQKYLHFDIDFTRKRDFEEIQAFIMQLFLRKKAAALKAIGKVKIIVQGSPFLKKLFSSENGKAIQKIEEPQSLSE